MRNYIKNTAIGSLSARSAIATQQLPLFVELPTFEVDPPAYPLLENICQSEGLGGGSYA